MNNNKFYFLMLLNFCALKAETATVEGLKKIISRFADEDKSYITLYAAELGLSYENNLATRRKQYCTEIKYYVSLFSPSLTGEMLSGKIDQDKLDWVNNICPEVLPKTQGAPTAETPSASQNSSTGSNNTSPAPASNNSPSPVTLPKQLPSFHQIHVN